MATTIFCRRADYDLHSFYIRANGKTYYLFSQPYKRSTHDFFEGGICLDRALDFSRAKGNFALLHTMEKLPAYIRYVERVFEIAVLRKTAAKNAYRRARIA